MSEKPKETTVSLSIPTLQQKITTAAKVYVPFTDDNHKKALAETFPNYEKTAIAKELAETWFPYVIQQFREAVRKGHKSITFKLE